jgi:CRP-like cAMP-binding protein
MFEEGQTIIQEGEYGETFYIIYSGKVTVMKFKKNEVTGIINMVLSFI